MLLIVDNKSATGNSLALAFSYMGILAKHTKPASAHRELSSLYRAVLIKSPEELPDCGDFVKRLRLYSEGIPLFALSDNMSEGTKELFDAHFPLSATASAMAIGIIKASKLLGCAPIGEYKLAGIDASATLSETEYFFTRIKLTAKESMILRFLIRTYPMRVSAKDILKHAFSQTKMPEPSAVRTHIFAINKKFLKTLGKRLITSPDGDGYIIMTPELSEKNAFALVNK